MAKGEDGHRHSDRKRSGYCARRLQTLFCINELRGIAPNKGHIPGLVAAGALIAVLPRRYAPMALRTSILGVALILSIPATVVAQDQPVQDEAVQQEKRPENPAEPESHGTRLRWQDIPKNVFHDEIAIFTSPFHINRDNAKLWIGFAGTTAALIATDQSFSNHLPQHGRLTQPSRWASRAGADFA